MAVPIARLLLSGLLLQAAVHSSSIPATENTTDSYSRKETNRYNATLDIVSLNTTTPEGTIQWIPLCEDIENLKYNPLSSEETYVHYPVYNATPDSSAIKYVDSQMCLIKETNTRSARKITSGCKKWSYEPEEFQILKNGSVLLYDKILEEETYKFDGDFLITCVPEDIEGDVQLDDSLIQHTPNYQIMMIIGQTGSILSVFALIAHLVIFAMVKSLHNLPGYNLACLSVAFLIAYFFNLFGQIPPILGTACEVSAMLVQYFFLAAFAWMNVISFDVWRALRSATTKFTTTSGKLRVRKFILYSLYAWILPLSVTIPTVVIHYTKNVALKYKPYFGRYDTCGFTNERAKTVFFAIPAFTLVVVNCIFFALSAYIIVSNTMKIKNRTDHHKMEKKNFFLYIRLAVIMGLTWIIGIAASFEKSMVIWFIFDLLNSLQGVFVFLLFPCSRKAWKYLRKATKCNDNKSTSPATSSTSWYNDS